MSDNSWAAMMGRKRDEDQKKKREARDRAEWLSWMDSEEVEEE